MKSNILSSLLVLMVLVTSANTASAQTADNKSWSTAGTTGTADKVDLNKIVYSNGIVSFPEVTITIVFEGPTGAPVADGAGRCSLQRYGRRRTLLSVRQTLHGRSVQG